MSNEELHRFFGGVPEEYLPIEWRYVESRNRQIQSVAEIMATKIRNAFEVDISPAFLVDILDSCDLNQISIEADEPGRR